MDAEYALKKHYLKELRMSMTTAMYCQPFYDEDGKYHHHDANTTTTEYRCSNGHQWTERTTGNCWCGWPNKEVSDEEN